MTFLFFHFVVILSFAESVVAMHARRINIVWVIVCNINLRERTQISVLLHLFFHLNFFLFLFLFIQLSRYIVPIFTQSIEQLKTTEKVNTKSNMVGREETQVRAPEYCLCPPNE